MSNRPSKPYLLRIFAFAVVAIGLMIVAAAPAHAGILNYVTNGGFESVVAGNSLGTAGGYFCQAGTTCVSNVANWTSTCHSGNSCGGGGTPDSLLFAGTNGSAFNGGIGLYSAADSPTGGNYVAFDGDVSYNASISQTLTGLVAGNFYTLTFYQAAAQQNGTTGATTEHWQINFGSHQYNSTTMNNPSGGFTAWSLQTISIVADATTDTLTFLSQGTPTGQPPVVLLDGVSVVATPEPQTLLLVGLGLTAIPLLGRRRRRPTAQ